MVIPSTSHHQAIKSEAPSHIEVISEQRKVVAVPSLLRKPPLSPATEYQGWWYFYIHTKKKLLQNPKS